MQANQLPGTIVTKSGKRMLTLALLASVAAGLYAATLLRFGVMLGG